MKAKVFTITRRHWEEVKRNAESYSIARTATRRT